MAQTAQVYYGTGLATAMRTDLGAVYEKAILKALAITNKMVQYYVEKRMVRTTTTCSQ
ncbi:hypothetical protein [Robertmurraya korlensis]|uniref:hypothetical protein n=1 Tax=Robertmurraya korlensis TaxID=519977 RepID=UPI003F75E856